MDYINKIMLSELVFIILVSFFTCIYAVNWLQSDAHKEIKRDGAIRNVGSLYVLAVLICVVQLLIFYKMWRTMGGCNPQRRERIFKTWLPFSMLVFVTLLFLSLFKIEVTTKNGILSLCTACFYQVIFIFSVFRNPCRTRPKPDNTINLRAERGQVEAVVNSAVNVGTPVYSTVIDNVNEVDRLHGAPSGGSSLPIFETTGNLDAPPRYEDLFPGG